MAFFAFLLSIRRVAHLKGPVLPSMNAQQVTVPTKMMRVLAKWKATFRMKMAVFLS